ncbi:tRNA threonylcarbamoyl adenosine modification protein, Sua5/YciO/YrdC/YwlC family [Propionibacterium cyclohexanicum]|uniref:tRNA threonylcarbamoyl adenosine modification protein, Sua5/YciO/YrdC/YwlC family n=1 Tax=Propionibacterium cyclohexanicum TaxID=64702 RepID=A0A1H9Q5C0_9ACTN|nr:L-threonylcarbamoyladenylate synthase [Propionibacterium cyclohexanicum]SER55618.1 tRNA threonylcarbamoyl adenosine modification protein, Sua5/YciO/YrdC/YwlC family [Propionibacterium cyclohexanicum]
MARYYPVHPVNPQARSLSQVVTTLRDGGLIAYPTDSGFALGTLFGNKNGMDRIRRVRGLDERHHLTVVVSEFAQLGTYVDMDNREFRAVKASTPGPFTFILRATREVPRAMQHPSTRTVGVRVPHHVTALALLAALGEPLVSSTLILPGHTEPLDDGWQIKETLDNELDAVLDSGDVGSEPTTVVDLTGEEPVVLRVGGGSTALFT